MQWSALECKFLPRSVMDGVAIAPRRQRIPQIDKLLKKQVDPRLARFLNAVKAQNFQDAAKMCDIWADFMDINVLEECAALLSSHHIPIGEKAKAKLDKYSLLDSASSHKRSFESSDKNLDFHGGPLGALKELTNLSNTEFQELLKNYFPLSPELRKLKNKWSHEILGTKQLLERCEQAVRSATNNDDESTRRFMENLPINKQAGLVAEFMAKFTASSVSVTFPQSLAYICRQVGNMLEGALLNSVAERVQLKNYGAQSELLWSYLNQTPWNAKQKLILGAFWMGIVLHSCRFSMFYNGRTLSRPAFWQTWYMSGSSKRGIIVANQSLISQLKSNSVTENYDEDHLFVTCNHIPHLTPPHPWTSTQPSNRELYDRNLRLITSQSTEGQATVREALKSEAALPVLHSLNRLQSQPWRINQDVLRVLKSAGPLKEDNPVTSECEVDASNVSKNGYGAHHQQDRKIKQEQAKAERMRKIAATQWNQSLSIAEALGTRVIYTPMYMDFRGRCYPLSSSNLSFMGNDSFRSLFMFSEAKILGEDGLKWLKIHLANLYGECKLDSFKGREKWVDDHMKNINDSATNPLISTWWKKGSKPYQVLAACIDLANAYKNPEGPTAHLSRIPVQLDGTSNGLQHLVALAKDAKNAESVNLRGDQRGDVYTMIANKLENDSEAKHLLLDDTINRSTVKKAVMIYFYGGSTTKLAEILEESGIARPRKLANIIASILNRTFKPERAVQAWLTECAIRLMNSTRADHITRNSGVVEEVDDSKEDSETEASASKQKVSYGTPTLVWTSPLGLPVVQPYVQTKLMAIRTPLQSFYWPSPFHLPSSDKAKQIAGVAANFVHTLDAAHMLATANNMPSGHSFSAVHDSFWTHASTVPQLNQVLRTEFAKIHSHNILEEVWQEWRSRYEGYMTLATIYSDSPLYEVVMSLRAGTNNYGKKTDRKKDRTSDRKIQEEMHLENELVEFALHGFPPVQRSALDNSTVEWTSKGPLIGTCGRRLSSLKAWIPLEFPKPPSHGDLDVKNVKNAMYFFN